MYPSEVSAMPGVHDRGESRLCRRVMFDLRADGDLQDQGLQEPARLVRAAGFTCVDQDLRCAVDLVWCTPAHRSLRMNSCRAASRPVQVCQPPPSYRCTPASCGCT